MRYIPTKGQRFTAWHRKYRTIAFNGIVFERQEGGSLNRINAIDVSDDSACFWEISKHLFYFVIEPS